MNSRARCVAGYTKIAVGLLFSVLTICSARATEYELGAHAGGIGLTDNNSSFLADQSSIAYGVQFLANPYGWAALELDATFAHFDSGEYFSTSPGLVLYPVAYDTVKLGFVGGVGFYKMPTLDVKFGMNIGLEGEFAIGNQVSVGVEGRYHPVLSNYAPSIWTVCFSVAYKFGTGSW